MNQKLGLHQQLRPPITLGSTPHGTHLIHAGGQGISGQLAVQGPLECKFGCKQNGKPFTLRVASDDWPQACQHALSTG